MTTIVSFNILINKIKKPVFLISLFTIIWATQASAQLKPARDRADDLTSSMNCELGLFTAQLPDIYQINLNAANKMDAARTTSNGNTAVYIQMGKTIDKDRNIELRDALTPKQFSLYERISKGNQRLLKKTTNCRQDTWSDIGSCSF